MVVGCRLHSTGRPDARVCWGCGVTRVVHHTGWLSGHVVVIYLQYLHRTHGGDTGCTSPSPPLTPAHAARLPPPSPPPVAQSLSCKLQSSGAKAQKGGPP